MSAIAWEHPEGPVTALPRRPHLVLLPGGAEQLAPASRLRVTARGRLVLLVLAALVLASVLGLRAMGGADAAGTPHVVTVVGGQTLSDVAAAELPGMSISEGVLALQLANDLSTTQVNAGQRLVVPQG